METTRDESGRERIPAATGVHNLDLGGCGVFGTVAGDNPGAVRAGSGGDAGNTPVDEGATTVDQVGGTREAQHLLVVRQQVIQVWQNGFDPRQHPRITWRQDVSRDTDARSPDPFEHARQFRRVEQLGRTDVHMIRGREKVQRHTIERVGKVGSGHVQCGPVAVAADGQHAHRGRLIINSQKVFGDHTVTLQHGGEQVGGVVATYGADRRHHGSEFGQCDGGAAGRARGHQPDVGDKGCALAVGYRINRVDNHIEHMGTERHDLHASSPG